MIIEAASPLWLLQENAAVEPYPRMITLVLSTPPGGEPASRFFPMIATSRLVENENF